MSIQSSPKIQPIASNAGQANVPVTGPLTNTQLRAAPVPVEFDAQSWTVSVAVMSTPGATSAGCLGLIVENIGEADAMFGAGALKPGQKLEMILPSGNTFTSIMFDATGTSLSITQIEAP